MRPRILLIGATGVFGARLARRLAGWDVDLVLAARREEPLRALAAELVGQARVTVAVLDRARPDLAALRPWAVVDAAGPFQTGDVALARAAIAAGAHYVDLADGRDFVAGFSSALDAEAAAARVLAVGGASSTPALSTAVLDELTAGWREIESVEVAITPGARAPRGRSVVAAILSYVGRPVRVFVGGLWMNQPGWSSPRRVFIPGLGPRWASLCDTPDLDVLPSRFGVRNSAVFRAGLELAPLHLGLWLLSWPVRLGWVRSLAPAAGLLRSLAGLAAVFGSDRGGMAVWANGRGPDGRPRRARWSLVAESGAGPNVPVAAAAAVLRSLMEGGLAVRGARVCAGLVTLDQILVELAGLPIRTERVIVSEDPEAPLFRRVLGEGFATLPAAVRAVHGAAPPLALTGRGRARGGARGRVIRAVLGLPQPGAYPRLNVAVETRGGGEVWTRAFGRTRFTSTLQPGPALGAFEECFGPIRFAFQAEPGRRGFRWRFSGWSVGALPLPRRLAPQIRARAFETDGSYRFSVAVAHPFTGLLFAYAGRLA